MAQIADILAKALDSAADPFLPIQLLKNPGQDFVSDLVGHNLYLWVWGLVSVRSMRSSLSGLLFTTQKPATITAESSCRSLPSGIENGWKSSQCLHWSHACRSNSDTADSLRLL